MEKEPKQNIFSQQFIKMLEKHEGRKNRLYYDSSGLPHIGVGFNLTRPDADLMLLKAGIAETAQEIIENPKLQLDTDQIDRLRDASLFEAKRQMDSKVNTNKLPPHQVESLLSLAFNSPKLIGDKVKTGVKSNDSQGLEEEIRWGNNPKSMRGVQSRRHDEADHLMQANMPRGDSESISKESDQTLDFIEELEK